MESKHRVTKIVVAIRNDAPMVFCGDSPSYRLVEIDLTEDQMNKIVLRRTGSSGERDVYEEISRCYLV